MKTELRAVPHLVDRGASVVVFEVWQGGDFIATIAGTENGVRLISKHRLQPGTPAGDPQELVITIEPR